MQIILLIRPGETEYDQQGRIQGTLDIPLSEDGRRQCAETMGELRDRKPVAIYSSPCSSATQTAALMANELGLKTKAIDKLHNLDHGLWQGMLVEDMKTKQPKVYRQWQEQPETVCPPDGETVLEGKRRVAEVLKKLLKKHKEGTIAVVAPEPLASLVRHVLQQDELTDLWKSAEQCGHWEEIPVPEELVGIAN